MKLTEKLLDPSNYLLRENDFYHYFQLIFFELFNDAPAIDYSRESYNNLIFDYKLSEKEKNYYEKSYISLGENIDIFSKKELTDNFDKETLNNYVFSKRESDIIDFLLTTEKNELVQLGRVGWGKSTILQYVIFFLLPKSKKLKEKFIPIHFCMESKINKYNNNPSEVILEKLLYEEMLLLRIKNICSFINVDSNDFWEYVKTQKNFINILQFETEAKRIYEGDTITYNREIRKNRFEQLQKREIILLQLKFLVDKKGKVPVIIIDNVDPLNSNVAKWLIWELHSLSIEYNIKTIIPLRYETYYTLFKNNNGLAETIHPARSNLNRPSPSEYVNYRLRKFEKEIDISSPVKVENILVPPNTIKSIYKNMFNLMLNDEVDKFISTISISDLRKLHRLLREYFRTGHLKNSHMFQKLVFKIDNPHSKYDVPHWLVYRALITWNYKTFFSKVKSEVEQDILINIFCNGSLFINTYLVRIHMLSFWIKHAKKTYKEFKNTYLQLFPKKQHPMVLLSLNHSLRRLVNSGSLKSFQYYLIDNDELASNIMELEIDAGGYFYLNNLMTNFEYISYMKDDVDYQNYKVDIKDNTQVHSLYERYTCVINFISFFFNREVDFLEKLGKKKLTHYSNVFSFDTETLFFSLLMINEMVDFGTTRNVDLSKARDLQLEIKKKNEILLERI